MIKSPTTLLLLFSLIIAIACGGDDDDDNKLRFEGLLATDDNNNSLGAIGTRDIDDWQNEGELDGKIMKLLDAGNTMDLSETGYATIKISAYPNPAIHKVTLFFSLSSYSHVEFVMVNEDMKVLYKGDGIGSGGNTDVSFTLDVSNREKFPGQKIVRVYYSISQKDDPDYFVGHGDILICEDTDGCVAPYL